MNTILGIVAVAVVALDWWLYVWSATEPPEQRHDVLPPDNGAGSMEGSFREW